MFKQLFSKKRKIEVFVRHCTFSEVSQHKKRFPGYSRELCYQNLIRTIDPKLANLTFFLDSYHPSKEKHFVQQQDCYPVIEIKAGSETGSFLQLLDHVTNLELDPETLIYFLEDDYLHRDGWCEILMEAFSLPGVDYATLFDHRDKYFHPSYENLQAKVFHTQSCHWRTTPSTTNTYAMRLKTLLRDLPIHREFSEGRRITADHDKFCKLGERGAILVSSIPGWSAHMEPEFASPCFDWHEHLHKEKI